MSVVTPLQPKFGFGYPESWPLSNPDSLLQYGSMIALELPVRPKTDSKILIAGYEAERQMAYYLKRAFDEPAYEYRVFNNLRLERRGDFAQIDHLVLHRYGFHLIESKSVAGTFTVDADGQFIRKSGRHTSGIPSPIEQVKRQYELLFQLLVDHKTELRRKMLGSLLQGTFGEFRFHCLVAIADHGIIKTSRCKKPAELLKADQIVKAIREYVDFQKKGSGFTGLIRSIRDKKIADETIPPYTDDEIDRITEFLLAQNTPLTRGVPASQPKAPRKTKKTSPDASRPPATPAVPKTIVPPHAAAAAPAKPPTNNMKRWSRVELDQLTQAFHAKTPASEVAGQLGRTAKAVRMRAQILDLIQSLDDWP